MKFKIYGTISILTILAMFCAASMATDKITVMVGKTITFTLLRQPMIIGMEDESIASLELFTDGRIRVYGKKIGHTRIIGRDYTHFPIIINVNVISDGSVK